MGLTRPAAWAAMLMLAAAPAAAQGTRPERPSRALFGSGVGDVSQLLTAAASISGGFDSSIASDARGIRTGITAADLGSSGDGIVTGARLALNYSLDTNPFTFVAVAEAAPRYYPSVSDEFVRRDHAAVSGNLRLPFAIVASASAGYVPYSALAFTRSEAIADDLESIGDELPVSSRHYYTWRTGLGTSRRLSRRTFLDVDTTYRARRGEGGLREFHTVGGGGRLRYQAAEHLFLKAGYRYVEARYEGRGSYARHLIDVGADMSRDFSIARRTTFGFSTGTSLITYPETDTERESAGSRNRFRVSGAVDLRHEMGRTWTASIGYQRGVQFLEAWPEPLLSDAASAKLDGSISRRLQFSASFRASKGRGAHRVDDNGFNYYHGGANLTYAFSRHINAGVLYSTYRHRFGEGLALPPGFGPWFDRHRVMVQVSVWAPLFSRARRGNATR